MDPILLVCPGGSLRLPDPALVLVDREDGGNLIVDPPRAVWDRSELSPEELTAFSFLVAAAGRAMLDTLPQLEGGCINYWDAGNWALNVDADPPGPKTGNVHRRLHLHLLGRSRAASNPALKWGEAPIFPPFADRHKWAARNRQLTGGECRDVVIRATALLTDKYAMDPSRIESTATT